MRTDELKDGDFWDNLDEAPGTASSTGPIDTHNLRLRRSLGHQPMLHLLRRHHKQYTNLQTKLRKNVATKLNPTNVILNRSSGHVS